MRKANTAPHLFGPPSGFWLALRHGWNLMAGRVGLQAPLGCRSHTWLRPHTRPTAPARFRRCRPAYRIGREGRGPGVAASLGARSRHRRTVRVAANVTLGAPHAPIVTLSAICAANVALGPRAMSSGTLTASLSSHRIAVAVALVGVSSGAAYGGVRWTWRGRPRLRGMDAERGRRRDRRAGPSGRGTRPHGRREAAPKSRGGRARRLRARSRPASRASRSAPAG